MISGAIRVVALIPEPDHAWIAFAPREWPAAPREEPWLDIARKRMGELGREEEVASLAGEPFDDVVYLPPVDREFAAARNELAARLATPGTPVLVQLRPGEGPLPAEVTVVWDATAELLVGDLTPLSSLPPSSSLFWPLLPGITDDPHFVTDGCRRLADAGVAVVQAVAPELTPAERRHLAEAHGEGAFDRLFHGPAPDVRAFARIAHGFGLAPFLPRPLPRPPLAGAANREIAGLVALAGELADRLGRPQNEVQALLRAARGLDRGHHDPRALAREGHLGLLEWLDAPCREIVEDWAAHGRSRRLDADLAEYLGPEGLSSVEEGTKA